MLKAKEKGFLQPKNTSLDVCIPFYKTLIKALNYNDAYLRRPVSKKGIVKQEFPSHWALHSLNVVPVGHWIAYWAKWRPAASKKKPEKMPSLSFDDGSALQDSRMYASTYMYENLFRCTL